MMSLFKYCFYKVSTRLVDELGLGEESTQDFDQMLMELKPDVPEASAPPQASRGSTSKAQEEWPIDSGLQEHDIQECTSDDELTGASYRSLVSFNEEYHRPHDPVLVLPLRGTGGHQGAVTPASCAPVEEVGPRPKRCDVKLQDGDTREKETFVAVL